MAYRRRIEIFTAGCPVCKDSIEMVRRIACDSCDVALLDLNEEPVARRAADLGIRSVPAVVVDGELIVCCDERGVSEKALRDAGVGRPISSVT